ncbi:hypothetical protein T4C_6424 [Trichinella pseudospiralis]|uniref:Uncharacterized protein n=1 Tax=Trichinella pseudospiralis TaxID=6337 RepID=A0A0V1ISY4_TRIPS|nr:hypothetical protein T4C_6424 [Trichinella pseudospiralis]
MYRRSSLSLPQSASEYTKIRLTAVQCAFPGLSEKQLTISREYLVDNFNSNKPGSRRLLCMNLDSVKRCFHAFAVRHSELMQRFLDVLLLGKRQRAIFNVLHDSDS